jgi:hypothetical protein
MRTPLLLLCCFLLAGCGFRSGLLRDSSTHQNVELRMDVAQVHYQRSAEGSESIGMLFCAIPLGEGQYTRAMGELHRNANLQPNEILVNYREDHGFTTILGVWCNDKVIISADVLRVVPVGAMAAQAPAGPTPSWQPPAPGAPKAGW